MEQYRIQDGALAVYDFIWTDLCDWYVEYAKDAPDKQRAFAVLNEVFFKALKLLHPYMPFITEEIAHQLGYLGEKESIMKAEYPKASGQADEETYRFVNLKREAITALRALRAEYKVPPSTFVKVTIATADGKVAGEIASLKKAMRAESVELVAAGAELAMPSKLTGLGTVYLSLEGLVDKAAEAKRIQGEIAKVAGFIKSGEAKLANRQFVDHAPAAIVDEARRKLAENQDTLVQLEKLLKLFA